jgi:hypothetical protein
MTGAIRKITPFGLMLQKQLTIRALQGLECQPKPNGVVYLEMVSQVVHQVWRLEIRGPGQVMAILLEQICIFLLLAAAPISPHHSSM